MPVDKFGRNGDRATPVYTGINIAKLTNSFLRGDGSNTAIVTIDMNSNIINPLDAGRRSTDFAQTPYAARSLLIDGTVYERSGWKSVD